MAPVGKFLIIAGLVMAAAGTLLMFSDRLPLIGKLPGDITIKRDNFQVYIPIATSLLLSAALSLVLWLASFFSKK